MSPASFWALATGWTIARVESCLENAQKDALSARGCLCAEEVPKWAAPATNADVVEQNGLCPRGQIVPRNWLGWTVCQRTDVAPNRFPIAINELQAILIWKAPCIFKVG